MISKERLRARYLRDPLSIRLGELAVTFGYISFSARNSTDPLVVQNHLHEARYFIEWTAADADSETAAELVSMQRLITLWLKVWDKASPNKEQRTLLSVQAKHWSDQAMDFSGLLTL